MLAPDRNVSMRAGLECQSTRSIRRAVGMSEIAALAISKGCGKSGTVSSFHAFHQTVISTVAVAGVFDSKSGP